MLLVLTIRECGRGRWRRAALPTLLLRDGTWAFVVVFGMSRVSVRDRRAAHAAAGAFGMQGLFFLVVSGPLAGVAWPWQSAASSFAACRLVLRTYRHGAAVRQPPTPVDESAGFALTTFVPGLDSDDTET
jgi:hypothetical protein